MNEKIDDSPYCQICGTCGYIGCCGIRNFISEHIENKTNCKNEDIIIQELIDLCDYKDAIFIENKRLNNIINELEKDLEEVFDRMKEKQVEIGSRGYYYTDLIPIEDILHKVKELKGE